MGPGGRLRVRSVGGAVALLATHRVLRVARVEPSGRAGGAPKSKLRETRDRSGGGRTRFRCAQAGLRNTPHLAGFSPSPAQPLALPGRYAIAATARHVGRRAKFSGNPVCPAKPPRAPRKTPSFRRALPKPIPRSPP